MPAPPSARPMTTPSPSPAEPRSPSSQQAPTPPGDARKKPLTSGFTDQGPSCGRSDRTRTCNLRFWRPLRCQLRHTPQQPTANRQPETSYGPRPVDATRVADGSPPGSTGRKSAPGRNRRVPRTTSPTVETMVDRVAVLSDIHGVLPALEAVLAEPGLQSADRIVLTGEHRRPAVGRGVRHATGAGREGHLGAR